MQEGGIKREVGATRERDLNWKEFVGYKATVFQREKAQTRLGLSDGFVSEELK